MASRRPAVRLIGMVAGFLMVLTAAPAHASSFRDVPPGRVFAGDIAWLAQARVTTGYADNTFRPLQPVLRDQMAAFLYRYVHDGANASRTATGFRDIASAHVFSGHVRWLSQTGITTGYTDGTFRPAQPVLRDQMAAFLYRLAGATATSRSCGFTDVPRNHHFAKEICWAKNHGITTGYRNADGTRSYRGFEPVLRDQMAAFLHRFDGRFSAPLAAAGGPVTRILFDTNAYRISQRRAPVVLTAPINTVAQNWAKHLHDSGNCEEIWHNPNYASQIPAGWSLAAENIAAGQQYTNVVQSWIRSPGHRTNLLGNFTHIGIGYHSGSNCYQRYFVQVFARY